MTLTETQYFNFLYREQLYGLMIDDSLLRVCPIAINDELRYVLSRCGSCPIYIASKESVIHTLSVETPFMSSTSSRPHQDRAAYEGELDMSMVRMVRIQMEIYKT